MEQFYTLLTDVGKAKIANATALQIKVKFSKILIGDSNGSYYEPTETQTKLKNKVWEGGIGNISVDKENPNWIILESVIPSNAGGFTIREVGITDEEGDLVIIAKYPQTYKPKIEDGSTKDLIIKTILEVSNMECVTLKVDPTIILATKKDIEVLDNKINNIKIPVESVNSKTGKVELTAADIKATDGTTLEQFKEDATSQLADMTQQIENIDLSADKVIVNNSNLNSKDVNSALTELFQYADNGKRNWVDVIGSPLSAEDDFSTLKSKTQTLKNTFASNLSNKKVSASGTESLNNLINKIKNINVGAKTATGTIELIDGFHDVRGLGFKPLAVLGKFIGYEDKQYYFARYLDYFNISGYVYQLEDQKGVYELLEDGFNLYSRDWHFDAKAKNLTWWAIGE